MAVPAVELSRGWVPVGLTQKHLVVGLDFAFEADLNIPGEFPTLGCLGFCLVVDQTENQLATSTGLASEYLIGLVVADCQSDQESLYSLWFSILA
jgi:hypothetical protein